MITTHIEGDDKGCPPGEQRAVSIKSWNNARLLCGVEPLGRRLTKVEFYIRPLVLVCFASSLGKNLSARWGSLLKSFEYFVMPLPSAVGVSQSRKYSLLICTCCRGLTQIGICLNNNRSLILTTSVNLIQRLKQCKKVCNPAGVETPCSVIKSHEILDMLVINRLY